VSEPITTPAPAWLWLLAFASFPTSVVIYAWSYATLWAWFVVPLGMPVIGWAHASGLSLLVHLVTLKREPEETEKDQNKLLTRGLWWAYLPGPMCVAVGWVLHWCMS
jgi:hypothetical protein